MVPKLLADILMPPLGGPGIDPNKYGSPTSSLEKIVSQVIGILTIIAVLYFAFQIIFAGYAYITSEGDEKKMETARKRITEGILGLVIVVFAVGLSSLLATLAGISSPFDLNQLFTDMGL